jgi:hypothetical protein
MSSASNSSPSRPSRLTRETRALDMDMNIAASDQVTRKTMQSEVEQAQNSQHRASKANAAKMLHDEGVLNATGYIIMLIWCY